MVLSVDPAACRGKQRPVVVAKPLLGVGHTGWWPNRRSEREVYFLQGSPTSLLDLQRANFTGAQASHVCT